MPALQLQQKNCTDADFYSIPENIRAELIDGQIYGLAAPSRIHQEILSALHIQIGNYINAKQKLCKIYPAPFDVTLKENTIVEPDISVICDRNKLTKKGCTGVREYWIVNPMNQSIYVYYLEETAFQTSSHTFQDTIRVNIYDDLYISFPNII